MSTEKDEKVRREQFHKSIKYKEIVKERRRLRGLSGHTNKDCKCLLCQFEIALKPDNIAKSGKIELRKYAKLAKFAGHRSSYCSCFLCRRIGSAKILTGIFENKPIKKTLNRILKNISQLEK